MELNEIYPPFVQYESPDVTVTVALGPNIDENNMPFTSPSDSEITAEVHRFVAAIQKLKGAELYHARID